MLSYRTDKWWVSHYNFEPEVRKRYEFPEKVVLHDTTLRDGEQQPGVVFRMEEKVEIAQKMDEVGVHRIEAGMPAVSDEDFQAIKKIAHLGLNAEVFCLARTRKQDVDLALSCGVDGIILELPSSETLLKEAFGWDEEKVLNMIVESATYAKEHGLHVVFFPFDTTKASWEWEKKVMEAGVKEGHVDSVTIVDTFGVALPDAMYYFVKKVRETINVPVEVHPHNDLGMATAVAMAGVAAGASAVHTCVNGMGERCGNTPLEEIAVDLLVLYGIDTGIKYEKLYELSKLVEKYSGIPIEPRKPLVGANPFRWESGIAVQFLERLKSKGLVTAATAVDPSFLGREFEVVLGKKSGKHSIASKLKELGLTATPEQLVEILGKVKDLSIKNKRLITDDEFKDILRSVGLKV